MTWSTAVLRLQDIDLEFQRINHRLVEIEIALQDELAVVAAKQEFDQCNVAAASARRVQKDLEFELGQVQIKLDQTENKLYGGRITNSRELQDLQLEFESLKHRKASLEDKVLEKMMAAEEATEAASAAETALAAAQGLREALLHTLSAERDHLRTHGQTLLGEAAELKGQIPKQIMDSYYYLKERTGGIPVAKLKRGLCLRCGMEVLSVVRRKAEHGEEVYCNGCNRLLVLG